MKNEISVNGKREYEYLLDSVKWDDSYFNLIYDFYYPIVLRNVIQLKKGNIDAEDIVQEVFISFWLQRLQLVKSNINIRGWLIRTSYYKTMTYLRTKYRLKLLDEASTSFELAKIINIEPDDSSEEKLKQLFSSISKLSVRRKSILFKCKLENKTYKETAVEMSLSVHTIKENINAAMASLKTDLDSTKPG